MKLIIKPQFRDLIPALAPEEYTDLENSLLRDGCLDTIKVWLGIIVDGHNRYTICQKHSIPFETQEMGFEDEQDATIWIIRNQFARRNINAAQRGSLALKLKPLIAEKAKQKQMAGLKVGSVLPIIAKREKPIHTREELAEIAGISHESIRRIQTVEQSGNKEVIKQMLSGEKSITRAYKEVMPNKTKVCSYCHKEKPMSEFSGTHSECRECHAFIHKNGREVAKLASTLQHADLEAILSDMSTKRETTAPADIDTQIVTDLVSILNEFCTRINRYTYMRKELAMIGAGGEAYEIVKRAETSIKTIKAQMEGDTL